MSELDKIENALDSFEDAIHNLYEVWIKYPLDTNINAINNAKQVVEQKRDYLLELIAEACNE